MGSSKIEHKEYGEVTEFAKNLWGLRVKILKSHQTTPSAKVRRRLNG
jgi:hypothetical protein